MSGEDTDPLHCCGVCGHYVTVNAVSYCNVKIPFWVPPSVRDYGAVVRPTQGGNCEAFVHWHHTPREQLTFFTLILILAGVIALLLFMLNAITL